MSRYVGIPGRIERHGDSDIACRAKLNLSQHLRCAWVGLENSYPVLLVEQEVEITAAVDLDGVEPTLARDCTESSEGQLLFVLSEGKGMYRRDKREKRDDEKWEPGKSFHGMWLRLVR